MHKSCWKNVFVLDFLSVFFLPSLQDLEDFVNGSGDDGFIVFSMGSVVSTMPEEKAKHFLDAFRKIPQRVMITWVAHCTSMESIHFFILLFRIKLVNTQDSATRATQTFTQYPEIFTLCNEAKCLIRLKCRTLSSALPCSKHTKPSIYYLCTLHNEQRWFYLCFRLCGDTLVHYLMIYPRMSELWSGYLKMIS